MLFYIVWQRFSVQVTRLCDLSVEGDSVTSVGWSERVGRTQTSLLFGYRQVEGCVCGYVSGSLSVFQGNHVAVGTHKGFVQIWDAAAGKKLFTLEGHTARVGTVRPDPG